MSYSPIILLKAVPCPLPSCFKKTPTIEVWIIHMHYLTCVCVCVDVMSFK